MSAYIKLGDIEGESQDDKHKGWIDIESFSQGISRPIDSQHSGGAYRSSANMSDISIMKMVDKTTPKLSEAICKGTAFPKVNIDFMTSVGDGNRVPYLQIELKNARVTSFQVGAGADSKATESLSLNYEEIKWTYTQYDKAGKSSGKVESTWKLEAGTK